MDAQGQEQVQAQVHTQTQVQTKRRTKKDVMKDYNDQIKILTDTLHIPLNNIYDAHYKTVVDIFLHKKLTVRKSCVNSDVKYDLLGIYYLWFDYDYDKGIECFTKSIECGNQQAPLNFAMYWEDGEGNYDKAIHYHKIAVERNNAYASYKLGCLYYSELNDCNNGFFYLSLAVEKGCVDAIDCVASHYYTRKDYEMALYYFELGVDRGVTDLLYDIGHYYLDIKKDYDKGVSYYLEYGKYNNHVIHLLVELVGKICNYETLYLIYEYVILHGEPYSVEKLLTINSNVFDKWKIVNSVWDKHMAQISNDSVKKLISVWMRLLEEKIPDIKLFKNRWVRASRHNVREACPICLDENVLNIDMGCGHGVCYQCSNPSLKCVYRCNMC